MISMLRGVVEHIAGNQLTLEVNGVGYEVLCTSAAAHICEAGQDVKLIIHTDVKEDSIKLYGFSDHLEKQVFLLLTTVKGIGAKSAADVVSRIDKLELLRLISSGDLTALQRVKGIGKKTSERILVELKDKVGEYIVSRPDRVLNVEREVVSPFDEALQALMALGFARKDAERAVQYVQSGAHFNTTDSALVVKEALRVI